MDNIAETMVKQYGNITICASIENVKQFIKEKHEEYDYVNINDEWVDEHYIFSLVKEFPIIFIYDKEEVNEEFCTTDVYYKAVTIDEFKESINQLQGILAYAEIVERVLVNENKG